MMQIWIPPKEDKTTKYAYFANGTARFATVASFASADMVRLALLDSKNVRADIQPQDDKKILWHDDDKGTISAYFQQKIDDIQAAKLQQIIGADIYRYIVYILKFLELMSAQLGITKLTDAVILGHEAGSDPLKQQELAATWAEKSGAWLNVVGVAEREASKAKKAISAANNDVEMRAIVDAFPSVLSEALE